MKEAVTARLGEKQSRRLNPFCESVQPCLTRIGLNVASQCPH